MACVIELMNTEMAKHSNSTDNMVDVLQQIVELAVAHDIQI